MKKTVKIIAVVLLINFFIIFFCVKSGLRKGDAMLRFHEREAVTFLSSLMLGLSSLASFVIYWLKRKLSSSDKNSRFWLFSALGFFYLCMDDYFMAHEGMDNAFGKVFFGKDIESLNLDNLVIAFFGLVALAICVRFFREILKHKEMLPFLFLGACGLLGTIIFHSFERVNIAYEVTEEAFKLVGVSFFLAAYLVALITFIKKLYIYLPDKNKEFTQN